MPRFLMRLFLPAVALLSGLIAVTGCIYYLPPCSNVEILWADVPTPHGPHHEDLPPNRWVENVRAASYVHNLIDKKGRTRLAYAGYDCSPQPAADCPDCLLCTRTISGASNAQCKPEGDLFIRAYVGPGSNVQAQTYWKK